jgi:hypothetical protein
MPRRQDRLDQISRGRLILRIGAGFFRRNTARMVGNSWPGRRCVSVRWRRPSGLSSRCGRRREQSFTGGIFHVEDEILKPKAAGRRAVEPLLAAIRSSTDPAQQHPGQLCVVESDPDVFLIGGLRDARGGALSPGSALMERGREHPTAARARVPEAEGRAKRRLSDRTCAYRLCHPNVVPVETAEPSD